MYISYFNAEHYASPTEYEGQIHMECEAREKRFRPIVYICSPYSGDTDVNKKEARKYSRFAVDKGYLPITPHLLFPQFLDDSIPRERELGLFMGIVLLTKCSELWVFGDTVSQGMKIEIAKARRKAQTIRYFTTNLVEIKKNI